MDGEGYSDGLKDGRQEILKDIHLRARRAGEGYRAARSLGDTYSMMLLLTAWSCLLTLLAAHGEEVDGYVLAEQD
jgi:hypothetical protein